MFFFLVQIYSLWQQLMVYSFSGEKAPVSVLNEKRRVHSFFGLDYFPDRMMRQAGLALCVFVCACIGHGLHP